MRFLRKLFVFGCLPLLVLLFAAAVVFFRPWALLGRVPAGRLIPPSASAIGVVRQPMDLAGRSRPARIHGDLATAIAELTAQGRDQSATAAEIEGASVALRAIGLLAGSHFHIIFASWEDPESETGEYASPLLLLPEESPWTAHLDRLILATAKKGTVIREEHEGRRIIALIDEETGDAVAWTRVGGWVVLLPRAVSFAPLRATIDHYSDDSPSGAERALPPEVESCPDTGFVMAADRADFAAQMKSFLRELGMDDSEIETTLAGTLARLREVDRIVVAGGGGSGELSVRFQGRGLADMDAFRMTPPEDSPVREASPESSASDLAPALFQFDSTYAFATDGAELAGLRWNDWVEALSETDWLQPGFADGLKRRLDPQQEDPSRRVGWALFPTLNDTVPVAAVWADADALHRGGRSPADAWRLREESEIVSSGDARVILGIQEFDLRRDPERVHEGRRLDDELWAAAPHPPMAFASIHFDQLAASLEAFPAVVLKKKDQEEWRNSIRAARLLDTLFGALAARLDRDGDDLVLRVKSL